MKCDAVISDCGVYRYFLTRQWSEEEPDCWIMLNPSTADASRDDPTIRRVIGFSRGWGAGGIVVVNLFALRATDPMDIYGRQQISVGKENNASIVAACRNRRVIAAWGCHKVIGERDRAVVKLLNRQAIYCLGTSKAGHPYHPLYLPASRPLQLFKIREVL